MMVIEKKIGRLGWKLQNFYYRPTFAGGPFLGPWKRLSQPGGLGSIFVTLLTPPKVGSKRPVGTFSKSKSKNFVNEFASPKLLSQPGGLQWKNFTLFIPPNVGSKWSLDMFLKPESKIFVNESAISKLLSGILARKPWIRIISKIFGFLLQKYVQWPFWPHVWGDK